MPHAGRPHLAGIRRQPAGDNADQRTFARAVRPQKAIQARAEGERHPGQSLFGFRLTLSAAVQKRGGQQIGFAQIVQFEIDFMHLVHSDVRSCPRKSCMLAYQPIFSKSR